MMDGTSPLLGLSQRLPPSNVQAEQCLLGAILANNKAYDRVADFLRAEHFGDPIHAAIFERIAARIDAGHLADAVTLKNEFEHSGILDEVGGTYYLAQLLIAMVGIINAGEYGRAIYDAWVRRKLIEIGEATVNNAFGADIELDGEAQVAALTDQALSLMDHHHQGVEVLTISEAAGRALAGAEAIHRGDANPRLRCGFPALDKALAGGMLPGWLTILGGRPGMGKTALAMQWAVGAASIMAEEAAAAPPFSGAGGVVVMFSYEMSGTELGGRELSRWTDIPSGVISRGDLTEARCLALTRGVGALAQVPLVVVDSVGMTVSQARALLRVLSRQHRIRAVVFDHLQKMPLDPRAARSGMLGHAVGQITSALKDLARSMRVPILLLAQLTREVDRRPDPRPAMADLQYAGEADADAVLLIWRPEKYLPPEPTHNGKESGEQLQARIEAWRKRDDEAKGKAELIAAKIRGGPESSVWLEFDGSRTTFAAPGMAVRTVDLTDMMDDRWGDNGG